MEGVADGVGDLDCAKQHLDTTSYGQVNGER